MGFLNRWQCTLRRLWWQVRGGLADGHSYYEEERHDNMTVMVARCNVCGKVDIIWGKKEDFDNE